MTAKTEGRHAAEFVLSEANGMRSREVAAIATGQTIVPGQVVQDNGSGALTAFTGVVDSNGDLVTAAKGIALYGGGEGDEVSYIARDAEVNGNTLTFPDETTDGNERENAIASLASLGIIVRD